MTWEWSPDTRIDYAWRAEEPSKAPVSANKFKLSPEETIIQIYSFWRLLILSRLSAPNSWHVRKKIYSSKCMWELFFFVQRTCACASRTNNDDDERKEERTISNETREPGIRRIPIVPQTKEKRARAREREKEWAYRSSVCHSPRNFSLHRNRM